MPTNSNILELHVGTYTGSEFTIKTSRKPVIVFAHVTAGNVVSGTLVNKPDGTYIYKGYGLPIAKNSDMEYTVKEPNGTSHQYEYWWI